MKKKKWKKPKLKILYRARPEEAVLVLCKETILAGAGAGNCNQGGTWQGTWCEQPDPS